MQVAEAQLTLGDKLAAAAAFQVFKGSIKGLSRLH
jgi:hypothetical protein